MYKLNNILNNLSQSTAVTVHAWSRERGRRSNFRKLKTTSFIIRASDFTSYRSRPSKADHSLV